MNLGQKIIVLGCSGSGKSTFSKRIHDAAGLPLIHLDNVWWKSDRSHISREEFDQKLGEILQEDKWILDGDYSRTYEVRFQSCDTVFFLDELRSVSGRNAGIFPGQNRNLIRNL